MFSHQDKFNGNRFPFSGFIFVSCAVWFGECDGLVSRAHVDVTNIFCEHFCIFLRF